MPIDSRIVESRNTYFMTDVSRNTGVGHACGRLASRLGAPQDHRKLKDLQSVQGIKCGGLAADMSNENVEGAGCICSEKTDDRGEALSCEQGNGPSQLGVVVQVIRYEPARSVAFPCGNSVFGDRA